ncbi:MAG: CHAT domain-containing protein [Desulfobacteraceae bacterium]|nr:CHAT domain-containing protein [Desulfobacteraceae bacterium]
MTEKNNKSQESSPSDINTLLKERDRLDQVLKKDFKRDLTIILTDICGYTHYIDTMGDVNGRVMLLKHNDLVLPQIEANKGKVVEMVGDAVMASFDSQMDAIRGCIAIQKTLFEYNQGRDEKETIKVKIGVNSGKVLVDDKATFQGFTGDVANVAARIQSQAGADQIFVSKNVYEEVCKDEEILIRYKKTMKLKGKAAPLDIYSIKWKDNDFSENIDHQTSNGRHEVLRNGKSDKGLLQIEISRDKDHLKLSANEQIPGEETTIRHYQEIKVSMDSVKSKCEEMVDILNKTRRSHRVGQDILEQLKRIGQTLYDEMFSLNVKEKIKHTKAEYLSLKIDDQLVHIPWELLHDGQEFLSLRFNMGRLVKTRQSIPVAKMRALARPFKMLILADPVGDLKGAYEEGLQLRDYVDKQGNLINSFLDSGNVTAEAVKTKLRNFDIVHFAGHADYNKENAGDSGWQFAGANLKAKHITKMMGTASMPSLIFSNACQSARTEEWHPDVYFSNKIFGLANAFLLAGVRHYVGTFWEISDEASSQFAIKFYTYLFSGSSIGEAMRQSRRDLIKEHGEGVIAWASYALYGDPTFNYQDQLETIQHTPEEAISPPPDFDKEARTREEVIDFTPNEPSSKKHIWAVSVACILVAVAIVLWGWPGILREPIETYEKNAITLYQNGQFQEALHASELLAKKSSQSGLAFLIQGNVFLSNGKLEDANAAYQKVLTQKKGTDQQKAQAYVGLGRIFSIKEDMDQALEYYKKASLKAPDSRNAYLSQALLLEGQGNFSTALEMFGKAQGTGPDDRAISAISNETRKRIKIEADQEKQARIDKTIKALLETMNASSTKALDDDWTSRPLTLWLMDIDSQGFALQEGRPRLVASSMTDQILQQGRIKIVERALLDKLVQELKLGTSKLSDQNTSLSLGKILAAKLIVSGRMIYSGPQVQVSMRMIETETGQISAAINKGFGSTIPASVLASDLSIQLTEKVNELYPLRGKVLELNGDILSLNIGQTVGVKKGQQFKTIGSDLTLEVTNVLKNKSFAKVLKGMEKSSLKEGLLVEAI